FSTVPAGSFANAASVGANTVNGPGPLSVSTRPAASSDAARVLNWPAATAVWTISAWARVLALVALAVWPAKATGLARPRTRAAASTRSSCGRLEQALRDMDGSGVLGNVSSLGAAPLPACPTRQCTSHVHRVP